MTEKEKEISLNIRCFYDPKTKEIRCILSRDQWDVIEKHGGIKSISFQKQAPEKK